jgi:hypothetical protein
MSRTQLGDHARRESAEAVMRSELGDGPLVTEARITLFRYFSASLLRRRSQIDLKNCRP